MFRGSSFHTIDPKGRLIVPARFRKVLKKQDEYGVVVSNRDGCIYAFTFERWETIELKLLKSKTVSMERFKRFFLGNAAPLKCDKQDRILLPENLRTYAGIEKDVVLVGMLDRFEIWSRDRWDQENIAIEQALQHEDMQEEVALIEL